MTQDPMAISTALLIVAVVCGIWATLSAVLLTRWLDQHGLTTPFPFIGLFLFRNVGRYRELTRTESGKVGPLFYSYIIPVNAAWILASIALAIWVPGM